MFIGFQKHPLSHTYNQYEFMHVL